MGCGVLSSWGCSAGAQADHSCCSDQLLPTIKYRENIYTLHSHSTKAGQSLNEHVKKLYVSWQK